MTLAICTKNWVISVGPWKSGIFAVILLLVPLMWNCGGPKIITREVHELQTDSVRERVTTTVKPVTVPQSQVSLRLPPGEIMNLPPSAEFRKQSGQASVRVEYRDSLIFITATCDSLQLITESQSREIYHLRTELSQLETIREKPPNRWKQAKTVVFYIAAGMVLMFIINLKKRVL